VPVVVGATGRAAPVGGVLEAGVIEGSDTGMNSVTGPGTTSRAKARASFAIVVAAEDARSADDLEASIEKDGALQGESRDLGGCGMRQVELADPADLPHQNREAGGAL